MKKPIDINLKAIFAEHGFDEGQCAFYEQAVLGNDSPVISLENFYENVSIKRALELAKQPDVVIGPPVGMREFMRPLLFHLADDQEQLNYLNKGFESYTTEAMYKTGALGHYTTAHILNIYRSIERTPEEISETHKWLSKVLKERAISLEEFERSLSKLYRAPDLSVPKINVIDDPEIEVEPKFPNRDGPDFGSPSF